ncbi:MAG: hypothetical protein JWQ27_1220 [Ferruginibacter sp.]|nr:hypothetical protein [Ferruginibacter sp.]
MSAENNSFDEFYRQNYEAAETPLLSVQHWNDMAKILGRRPGPKKSFHKRTIRRVISYLGLLAIITTVTYFSVNTKRVTKVSNSTAQYLPQRRTKQLQKVQVLPAFPLTVSAPLLVRPKKKLRVSHSIIRVVSDTIFQQRPETYSKIIPAPNPGAGGIAVRNFLQEIKAPAQIFKINPLHDTMLFGSQGTVIKIQARSFVDSLNRLVQTPVIFELTECYNYADMLAHDLATTSGDAPLVSGGMLCLQAFSADYALKILPSKPVQVAMPRENYDSEMQLFVAKLPTNLSAYPVLKVKPKAVYVEDSKKSDSSIFNPNAAINWQPAGQLQAYQNKTAFVSRRYIKLFEVRQQVKTMEQQDNRHFIVSLNTSIPDEKVKLLLSNRYAIDLHKISLQKVAAFDDKKRAKNTGVILTKTGFVAGDSMMMLFELALKEKIVFEKDSLAFMKLIEQDRVNYLERIRKDSIAFVRQQEFDNAYRFDITGLGWINCDKFRRNDLERFEFSLSLPPGIDRRYGNFKIVFKNQRTILPGYEMNGRISFGKVPLNEPVQLVCIAENNGRAIVCLKNLIVTPAEVEKLSFEFMTPEQFKARLAKL